MGVGKAGNPQKSIENAIVDARKHMILVPRHEGSLLQPLKGKYGASKVIMRPKKPGVYLRLSPLSLSLSYYVVHIA